MNLSYKNAVMLAAPIIGILGGAYAWYANRSSSSYAPEFKDYSSAAYAVAKGLIIHQSLPAAWQSDRRFCLEILGRRPEVIGVNRALEKYGIDLDETELALFLAQGEAEINPFDPGFDLACERLIAQAFNQEYRDLELERSNLEADAQPRLEVNKKQAAAASVGFFAHSAYGFAKAALSRGAKLAAKMVKTPYQDADFEKNRPEVEKAATEQGLKVGQFFKKREVLSELKRIVREFPSVDEGNEDVYVDVPDRIAVRPSVLD